MQVAPQIHAFRTPFSIPIAPDQRLDRFVYVYALVSDREVWLIDSGVKGAESRLAAGLAGIGRDLGEVSRLLLTHAHPDHIGAAATIQRVSGCRILIHESEKAWLEDVDLQRGQRPVPGFDELVAGAARVDGTIADG
ncbi:MAG: MBL fold metallo-hydrolase, partial [Thermoguttaceae bacterium]